MKLNIKTMAEKAGVSITTFSRAINPHTRDLVASQTLKKIDDLVREYNYTPSLAARNLRLASTKTVGVVLPYFHGVLTHSYYNLILSGIFDSLLETEYQFKTVVLTKQKYRWDQYDFKAGEMVDGLIMTPWPRFFNRKTAFARLNIPCVLINDYADDVQARFVCADNVKGGRIAAEHLYSLGHRKVAVFTGREYQTDSHERLQGFRDFFQEQSITLDPGLIISGEFHEKEAYERMDALLKQKDKFSAVFCCNDQMAYGVIRRLKENGLSCPDDVSVMGFDDDTRAASFEPALTTIRVPVYEQAREAARALIDYLETKDFDQPLEGTTILPVSLLQRNSVRAI